jgi:Fe2+ or Zn2+ uptake regulation protein
MKGEYGKVRVLLVAGMLSYDKPISATKILKRLKARGITCDRKTVYSDIASIDKVMPVEVVPGCKGGFIRVDVIGRCEEE